MYPHFLGTLILFPPSKLLCYSWMLNCTKEQPFSSLHLYLSKLSFRMKIKCVMHQEKKKRERKKNKTQDMGTSFSPKYIIKEACADWWKKDLNLFCSSILRWISSAFDSLCLPWKWGPKTARKASPLEVQFLIPKENSSERVGQCRALHVAIAKYLGSILICKDNENCCFYTKYS